MHSARKAKPLRYVAAGIMASGPFGCLVAGETERQRVGVTTSALEERLCFASGGRQHGAVHGMPARIHRRVATRRLAGGGVDGQHGFLHVGTGTRVSGASGANALLTNMGGGETSETRIDPCARVTGDISSEPSVTVSPGATVSGAIRTGGDVTPANTLSWFVSFPRVAGSAVVISRGTKRELQPGNYGALKVESKGEVALLLGVYYFARLMLSRTRRSSRGATTDLFSSTSSAPFARTGRGTLLPKKRSSPRSPPIRSSSVVASRGRWLRRTPRLT